MPTMEQVVDGYIRLRDEKKRIADTQKEVMKPINEKLFKMEAWMQQQLNAQGTTNTKTNDGHTVYLSTRLTPKVVDREALFTFVREKEMWSMLTAAVSKEAVEEFLESTGDTPPGVTITRETNARVRR